MTNTMSSLSDDFDFDSAGLEERKRYFHEMLLKISKEALDLEKDLQTHLSLQILSYRIWHVAEWKRLLRISLDCVHTF